MNQIIKKSAIATAIVVFLSFIYFGSYLPFRKSQLFIEAYRNAQKVSDFNGFKKAFDAAFDFYSPVGQSEQTKFLSNEVLTMLQQRGFPKETAFALTSYVEDKALGSPTAGFYPGFTQELAILADLRKIFGIKYKDVESLELAERYYRKILELSPRRPQALFGLFDIYDAVGSKDNRESVLREIVNYWPQYKNIFGPD